LRIERFTNCKSGKRVDPVQITAAVSVGKEDCKLQIPLRAGKHLFTVN